MYSLSEKHNIKSGKHFIKIDKYGKHNTKIDKLIIKIDKPNKEKIVILGKD